MPTDLLYPDSSGVHERALIGAKTMRGHSPEEIAEHKRRSNYFVVRDRLLAYVREADPEPTPTERAALAGVLIGGFQ